MVRPEQPTSATPTTPAVQAETSTSVATTTSTSQPEASTPAAPATREPKVGLEFTMPEDPPSRKWKGNPARSRDLSLKLHLNQDRSLTIIRQGMSGNHPSPSNPLLP